MVVQVVRSIGNQLIFAAPLELSIGNVMRRVLYIIREEYEEEASRVLVAPQRSMLSESLSMFAIEDEEEEDAKTYSGPYDIRSAVLEAIRHFIDDLGEIHSSISQQALEHIHEHEVVLTFGRSNTVLEFLKFRVFFFFLLLLCFFFLVVADWFLQELLQESVVSASLLWRHLLRWTGEKRLWHSVARAFPLRWRRTARCSRSWRE